MPVVSTEITTVADDEVVVHDGLVVRRYEGLTPDAEHELDGIVVRTLPRPGTELLCRFATVNDVTEAFIGRRAFVGGGRGRGEPALVDPAPVCPERVKIIA